MTSHRSSSWTRLAALLAAVALLPFLPAGAATEDRLEQTRSEIDQTLAELREVDAQAEQTQEQVAAAEAKVAELEEQLNELLTQLDAQQQQVNAARADAEDAASERDRIQRIIGERARRAFMGATPDPILMLGGEGMDDVAGALTNLAVLDALSARANASMETLDVARVRADATAVRLDEEIERLEDVRATREEVLDEAEVVLDQRAEALAALDAESDRLMARQEELEADEEELQELIREQEAAARRAEEDARRAQEQARQETQDSNSSSGSSGGNDAPPPPPPAPSGGCYAWPANGAVTSEYGPRWGRMHRGLDIDGDTGDPLYAAQSGTVTYTGYYSGYGNMTLIRHSDGVTTAYAHQSAFGVSSGQTVSRGEYIGRMGATGNVTGSHLHFETRTGSGAVNPRNYLC